MSTIQVWRQREVVEEIAGYVQENMQTAAKVVEVDARRRMLKIKDPEWGTKYRKLLALYRLTSIVERQGLVITGAIGLPPGKKGSSYGFYIETGSRTAPAHPWLRPALLTNLRSILSLLSGQ